MGARAPGPDDWEAEDLAKLPECWWNAAGQLWQLVLASGCIPQTWCQVKVVLIPKAGGGARPLSLTSVLWRLGARRIVLSLRSWIAAWADHTILKGLPERGVLDAHARLTHAIDCSQILVSQDLAKFFDSVQIPQACTVMNHLRAPTEVTRLIQVFYDQCQRVFSDRGVLGAGWHTVGRGILQGCPMSPLIAASIMHIWACNVCRDGVDGLVYLDDRTFWANGDGASQGDPLPASSSSEQHLRVTASSGRGSPGRQADADAEGGLTRQQALRAGKARSDAFDRAFGFQCRQSKCSVAAAEGNGEAWLVAQDFGYQASTTFAVLGVVHDVSQPTQAQLAKFDVRKVRLRLLFIRRVAANFVQRRGHIRALVIPALTWACGFAQLQKEELDTLRQDVLAAFGGRLPHDVAPCLLLEVISSTSSSVSFSPRLVMT